MAYHRLLKRIETLRGRMEAEFVKCGNLNSRALLTMSCSLDKLIVEYQRLAAARLTKPPDLDVGELPYLNPSLLELVPF